jgi:hypothetical protein
VAHPFQPYRKGWGAFAVAFCRCWCFCFCLCCCFLPLLVLLLLLLTLTCHPSPKAEDLLLLLPIPVFAVACSFAVFAVPVLFACHSAAQRRNLLLPLSLLLGSPRLKPWVSQPQKRRGFSPWGMPSSPARKPAPTQTIVYHAPCAFIAAFAFTASRSSKQAFPSESNGRAKLKATAVGPWLCRCSSLALPSFHSIG